MERSGANKLELPSPVINESQLQAELDTARRAGYILLQCGTDMMSHQHIAINPSGDDLKLWWEGKADVDPADFPLVDLSGLTGMKTHGATLMNGFGYDGVYRKTGRRMSSPKHLDLPPQEITLGDKVGLSERGSDKPRHHRSLTVEVIEHPLLRTS